MDRITRERKQWNLDLEKQKGLKTEWENALTQMMIFSFYADNQTGCNSVALWPDRLYFPA